MTGEPRS